MTSTTTGRASECVVGGPSAGVPRRGRKAGGGYSKDVEAWRRSPARPQATDLAICSGTDVSGCADAVMKSSAKRFGWFPRDGNPKQGRVVCSGDTPADPANHSTLPCLTARGQAVGWGLPCSLAVGPAGQFKATNDTPR